MKVNRLTHANEKKEATKQKTTQENKKPTQNNQSHSRRKSGNKQTNGHRGNKTTKRQVNTDKLDKSIEEAIEPKKESIVERIDHSTITISGAKYEIIKDYRDAFDAEQLSDRYSPILEKYDYIVADWGYEQLRLKGFYANNNRKVAPDKKISHLEDYLFEYCNFGASYFVLERLEPKKKQPTSNKENPRKKRKRRSNKKKPPFKETTGKASQEKTTPKRNPSKEKQASNKKKPFVQKEVTPKEKEKKKETVVVKTVKDEKGSRRFNIRRNDVDRVKNKS